MEDKCQICCWFFIIFGIAIFVSGLYVGRQGATKGEISDCCVTACKYSDWSQWSDCADTCGAHGTQFRFRSLQIITGCDGPEVVCEEPTTEQKPCNRVCYNGGTFTEKGCDCRKTTYSGSCCDCKNIDCELSTWTEWSSCENATTRVRSRDEVRKAECAGARCEGPYMEEQDCDTVGKVLMSEQEYLVLKLFAVLSTSILFVIICVFVFRRAAAAYKKNKKGYTRANDNDECEKDSFDMG